MKLSGVIFYDKLAAYEAKRITEAEYLNKVQNIMESVLSRTDSELPEQLNSRDVAKAFFADCALKG